MTRYHGASVAALTAALWLGATVESTSDDAAAIDGDIAALSQRVDDASGRAGKVIALYDDVAVAFGEGADAYFAAARAYHEAGDAEIQSAAKYEQSAVLFQVAAGIVVTATQLLVLRETVCPRSMSTGRYRMMRQVARSDDVDHAWPSSLGGADNATNYSEVPSSVNRSLGNDVVRKFLHDPAAVSQGALVSAFIAAGGCAALQ